jgi:hypothetical protein
MKRARNNSAWAIGTQRRNGFMVRRVVWGLLMASQEKREGEEIRAAVILVESEAKRRHIPNSITSGHNADPAKPQA